MEFICEHVVERKKEGMYRFKKSAIITAMVLAPAIIVCVCMALGGIPELQFMRAGLFLIPLFVWLAIKFGPIIAAYGEEAFEYEIASGEMTFATIYGDRFRREMVSFKLSELEACRPYDPDSRELDNECFERTYLAASTLKASHVYYAIFRDYQDRRSIIYFEVIKKSLKMIKTYYPQTVMTVVED